MPSQVNSVMRNLIRPIVFGLLMGLIAAFFGPQVDKARESARRSHVASTAQVTKWESGWRFLVLPLGCMFCFLGSSMVGVVLIPKRLAALLEKHDVSKGEAGMGFIPITSVAVLVAAAAIYESSFVWELERALKPYQGDATTFEYYPGHLCIQFRTSSIRDQNLPAIRDADLPSIVEIALRAERQHYWKSIALNLSHTDITDDGVLFLERLPNQIGVSLADTKVTSDGVELLRQKRPDLHVHFSNDRPGTDNVQK